MSVLFIGGCFSEKNESEIMQNSKKYAEFSANIFQKKLIKGFSENKIDIDVISAPFIGAYPFRYKKLFFTGFEEKQSDFMYVSFNNLWGYRNFSRAHSLKKKIKRLVLNEKKLYDLIVVYSAHEPFLEAAIYAKRFLPKAKICFVVPDLPQYMNLDANRTKIYDILKMVDIKRMDNLVKKVDSFVILTEPMKDMMKIGNRPYIVSEGIIDSLSETDLPINCNNPHVKEIVYTGKMNMAFGIKNLVDSFMNLNCEDYRLVLCGDGDARDYVIEKSKEDNRIIYRGQVPPEEAKRIMDSASVLVNPRPNDSEYTKYSFPSKNIEYLMSGKPVVAYMLDGMPECYSDFIYTIENENIKNALIGALNENNNEKKLKFFEYAKENLVSKKIVLKMYDL